MLEQRDLEMIAVVVTRAIEPLQKDVAGLHEEIAGMHEEIGDIREEIADINERKDMQQNEINGIKLILENEIKTSISIIAEGHLDLNRKLDQVLEYKEERELMKLKDLSLENEIRRIKEKIEIA